MAKVAVEFAGESAEFVVDDDRLIGGWSGPAGLDTPELRRRVADALESPRDFPPLRRAIVPGDRVVVAVDPRLPDAAAVLAVVCEVMAGVEPGSIAILAAGRPPESWAGSLPAGVALAVHDPDDRAELAYLATTEGGRRIYLNRRLVEADFVLPIGRLGHDSHLGPVGPWSAIFPACADAEAIRDLRAAAPGTPAAEAAAVGWLLGTQFGLGIVPGTSGAADAAAGTEAALRVAADEAAAIWGVPADEPAELVVAGVGHADDPGGLDELAEALESAAGLVRSGGKIVLLTRVDGTLGPAWQRLRGRDDAPGLAPLKGAEGDPDYPSARRLALAMAKADVYLLSRLDADAVEDIGLIPLAGPTEARRLVATAASCLFLSRAELARPAAPVGQERS